MNQIPMHRRAFLALGAASLAPLAAFAQQPGKIRQIGFFYNGSRQSALDTGRYGAFLQGMREIGYVEGRHFVLKELFTSDGDNTRLADMAAELVKTNIDVIVATGTPVVHALKQATTIVPVVVTITTDPVRDGVAISMSRPGGNFTGLSAFLDDIFPKHLEYLKLAVPKLSRVGLLLKKGNSGHSLLLRKIEAVTAKTGSKVLSVETNAEQDIEPAIKKLAQQHADALIILGDTFFVQHFRQIAVAANRHRLPSIYSGEEYPKAGGLMSYGPNFSDNFRRAASYVDKILKGAKPGDLPFEQPTRFYLTINSGTANALGIAISGELQLRADRVID